MSAAKSTPGPWTLFSVNRTLAIHKGPNPVVAWAGFDSADVGPHGVNVANARLIAAAPDLADTLEALLHVIGGASGPFGGTIAAARDALKKAGRQ